MLCIVNLSHGLYMMYPLQYDNYQLLKRCNCRVRGFAARLRSRARSEFNSAQSSAISIFDSRANIADRSAEDLEFKSPQSIYGVIFCLRLSFLLASVSIKHISLTSRSR